MTMAGLAGRLARKDDEAIRWKYVWEFLEEYRGEAPDRRPPLVADEPPSTGEARWDVLLAAIAEHLAAELDLAPPGWTASRTLETPWSPSASRSKRMEVLVWAPAAFRKHGVFLAVQDLKTA